MRINEYDMQHRHLGSGSDGNADQQPVLVTPIHLPGEAAASAGTKSRQATENSWGLVRLFDIVIAAAVLAFLAPLMVVIALTIFFGDQGPIIFKHRRVGRNGEFFECYKFRSMCMGAEEKLKTVLANDPALQREWERDQKLTDDPRITWIGGLLRVTSLDELPQLINVLRGEMGLVGPRPIVASEVARYGRFIASYYSVRPGLTGLWQVSGRSDTSYRRRIAYDVLYARSKCLGLDVKILFATIPAVIAGKGSY